MARPVVVTKSLAAADNDIIAVAQALAAAGNLTLVTNPVTLDTQRRVSILSAGNDTARIWTVYGANEAGATISENVAGANAVAVETQQDFLTVTRVAGDGAAAGNVQVGTNSTGSTPWFVPNYHQQVIDISVECELLSGAATFSVDVTQNSPMAPISIYQSGYNVTLPVPSEFAWPTLSALTANGQGNINVAIAGIRLTITAGTGTVRATVLQSGIRD